MKKLILLAFLVSGCGGAMVWPVKDRPGVYQLGYCADEEDCFKAAERTCPEGYTVTKYNAHPEEFKCN